MSETIFESGSAVRPDLAPSAESFRSRAALMLATMALLASQLSVAASVLPGPSVKDVVEFTRIVQPADHDPDVLHSQVSPDGARAFIVTRRADVAADRNLYEIVLLDVRPDRLATGRQDPPHRLLTVAATQDENYAVPFVREVRWIGYRTLVFLARINDAPSQIYTLDVITRALTQMTAETRPIVTFDVSGDLRRVVYGVQLPNPAMAPGARSVVVGNHSFWSVKFGQNDLRTQHRRYQYFVAGVAGEPARRALGEPFLEGSGYEPGVNISPDGRWALLPRYEPARQAAWARQYPLVAALTDLVGQSRSVDPLTYFSKPSAYTVRRMIAYRLSDGQEQPVVDAPDDAMPGPGQVRSDRLWLGDGRSVVIAGTHLPLSADRQTGTGSYIIEYWPDTGRWKIIAALAGRLGAALPIGGDRDAFVAIDGDRRRHFERLGEGHWREVEAPGAAAREPDSTGWALSVDEGLNKPPNVVASGPGGKLVRLTDLNPQFESGSWGRMQPYAWKDAQGRPWEGGLMEASGSGTQARRALVIQTYGFSPRRFYLDGPNVYDGYTSGFAGRAFVRENMLVLAMPVRPTIGAATDSRAALAVFMAGVRGAIDALVREGQVDPERVGILGWSATGEQVLNLVTFSDVPIRAASLLDGDANTVFSVAVSYGALDSIWSRKQRVNEGMPYGATLDRWVGYDPALHTDCVRAALRIETYGPWVLNNWDIYALLRRQYKAAEMVVIPGGAHALSRPTERVVSLQGNVDWYRFWLTGGERITPVLPGEDEVQLKAQYERWRQMAELKAADDTRPRCAKP